mmetsp:Transcript_22635/g.68023  ORF Transcript_22635/g.68023 Transcript_22635/m.68023 type:complete len:262 (+) Transcript_22635:2545-3330(+)
MSGSAGCANTAHFSSTSKICLEPKPAAMWMASNSVCVPLGFAYRAFARTSALQSRTFWTSWAPFRLLAAFAPVATAKCNKQLCVSAWFLYSTTFSNTSLTSNVRSAARCPTQSRSLCRHFLSCSWSKRRSSCAFWSAKMSLLPSRRTREAVLAWKPAGKEWLLVSILVKERQNADGAGEPGSSRGENCRSASPGSTRYGLAWPAARRLGNKGFARPSSVAPGPTNFGESAPTPPPPASAWPPSLCRHHHRATCGSGLGSAM